MKLTCLVSTKEQRNEFDRLIYYSCLADNRRKVRNMLSQAPDFSAFIRTTTNAVASKISAQMKVAVFQFLSTSN
jgi:hypothetical protein